MNVLPTTIADILIIEPQVWVDRRGFFFESFNQQEFNLATATNYTFVQDNHSRSNKGVLRGLHYQIQQPQGKLVRVTQGAAFDVAVDMRKKSPSFGQWIGVELSEENQRQVWIPPGFAHGYLVLSDTADVLYKTTDYYAPQYERSLLWSDPALDIQWPIDGEPFLADKDAGAQLLQHAQVYWF